MGFYLQEPEFQTSLRVQWMGICLPVQGTQVQSLVGEDSTCCAATQPMPHNHRSHMLWMLKLVHLKPVLCKKEPPWWEAHAQQKKKKRVAALAATRGCSAQQQRTSTTKIYNKIEKKREEEPGFLDSELLLAGWGEPRGRVLSGRISEILKCWYACQVLGCWGSRSWCHPKRHSLTSPPLPSWGVRSYQEAVVLEIVKAQIRRKRSWSQSPLLSLHGLPP